MVDQNSYAGFVDGEHWKLVDCFKEKARYYRLDGRLHAAITADRMATTADDIANDLVMAMFEIVEAEYEEEVRQGRDHLSGEYPHLEDIRPHV